MIGTAALVDVTELQFFDRVGYLVQVPLGLLAASLQARHTILSVSAARLRS
jgi:hypothetical protein